MGAMVAPYICLAWLWSQLDCVINFATLKGRRKEKFFFFFLLRNDVLCRTPFEKEETLMAGWRETEKPDRRFIVKDVVFDIYTEHVDALPNKMAVDVREDRAIEKTTWQLPLGATHCWEMAVCDGASKKQRHFQRRGLEIQPIPGFHRTSERVWPEECEMKAKEDRRRQRGKKRIDPAARQEAPSEN